MPEAGRPFSEAEHIMQSQIMRIQARHAEPQTTAVAGEGRGAERAFDTRVSGRVSAMGRLAGGAALAAAVLGTGLATLGSMPAQAGAFASAASEASMALDKLVLRNGKIIEGELLSETSTEVRFNVIVAGISAPATFKKSQIIEIVRGDSDSAAEGGADGDGSGEPERYNPLLDDGSGPPEEDTFVPDNGAPRVYVINLTGEFGKEISPTPVRDAVQAARKAEPDFLIIHLDNDWKLFGRELDKDAQIGFDFFQIADKLEPIFTKEIELEWEKQPHVVFWVGNAMGGAAFLPFLADEIYMEPEGRIGGIGTLEQMFEGVGDEVVRQKQRSLRLARAQGLAIANGYDYRFINALAQRSYVLSYDIYGNLYEAMPDELGRTDVYVLTDDGKGENADTMQQQVRDLGNDVLTLKADNALKLGLSSGTAADMDELLELLGILRNHNMIEGRSDQILESWARNVASAQNQVRDLYRQFNATQVGGTPREARRAISTQISLLEKVQGLIRRYGESFDPFGEGVGDLTNLETQIEQLRIRLLLMRD